MDGYPDVTMPRSEGRPRWLLPAAAVLLIGAAVVGGREAAALVPAFAEWVRGQGALGAVLFVLGYAVAVVAMVPGSVLTLAAGAIFGLRDGVILVLIAATLGASGAFLIARYLARDAVRRRLVDRPRFQAIDRAIEKEGRKIVLLLRLSPVFPFVLLNYGLGLTSVRFRDYVIASIGMLPGTLLYVYYGRVAGDLAALAAGTTPPAGAAQYAVLALGLIATLAVTILITRIARRALTQATGPDSS